MKIRETSAVSNGEIVEIIGVLIKNNLIAKTNGGGNYLQVSFRDSSGTVEFPVFDRAEIIHERLEEGRIYGVKGVANIWNGNFQIKSPVFTPMKTDETLERLGRDYFMQSYPIEDIKEAEEYITECIKGLDDNHRDIAEGLTGLLSKNSDRYKAFITAPSAEKHHGAKLGGLVIHVSGVLKSLNNMIDDYIDNCYTAYKTDKEIINPSRTRLKAIAHDIKKTDEYEYDTIIRRRPGVIGHLIDGCSYLTEVNNDIYNKTGKYPLDREELESVKYAILSHHGQYGPYQPKCLEDEILHLADMIDSRFVGAIEK